MRPAIAAAALLLALTGCGDDGSDNDAGTDSPLTAGVPDCSEIFTEGGTMPENFEGCTNDAGDLVAAIYYECDDGRKLYATDNGWGFAGEEVHLEGTDSDGYSAAFDECKPT